MSRRLKNAQSGTQALERAFDWLADGAMLVGSDGAVTYANIAMQEILRRNDGISLVKRRLEFSDSAAKTRYGAALAAVARRDGAADSAGGDIAVDARRQRAALSDFGASPCAKPYKSRCEPHRHRVRA